MRQCGDCQLCCKLLPVKAVGKLAGHRCRYQRHGKGCAVYANLERVSPECRLWSCRWLVEDDTGDLSRPDRSHYVIDIMPDFVTLKDSATDRADHVEAVQIWVDPKYPDAHRDPRLRAYLERRASENKVGLVRFGDDKGMAIFPPALSADHQWHEMASDARVAGHTPEQLVAALGKITLTVT